MERLLGGGGAYTQSCTFRSDELSGETTTEGGFLSLFACLNLRETLLLACLSVLGMLLMALSIEGFFHKMAHLASKSKFWHSILDAIEKELMILGMISFSLFLFEQGFKGMHIYHFHEIIEIVEFSHLILFFSMITYYLFVVLLGIVCNRHLSFLEKFEQNLKGRGENVWTLAKENDLKVIALRVNRWNWLSSADWECWHFYHMKNLFLLSNQNRSDTLKKTAFNDFEYADYIRYGTTKLFIKMIHVGWRIWLSLIIALSSLCLIFWILLFQGQTLNNQLENLFLEDGHPASDNNIVVWMLNVMGGVLLVFSRGVYWTQTRDSFGKRLIDLVTNGESGGSSSKSSKSSTNNDNEEGDLEMEDFAFENTQGRVERTESQSMNLGKNNNNSNNINNQLTISKGEATLGGTSTETDEDKLVRKQLKPNFVLTMFYRLGKPQPWDEPYHALWFLKAPDLMVRVIQANIFFFSFYSSTFILTLRFANSFAWCFIPFFPLFILFFVAYKMLPHYAAKKFLGNCTLDEIITPHEHKKTMW